jgi:hypothetical protein
VEVEKGTERGKASLLSRQALKPKPVINPHQERPNPNESKNLFTFHPFHFLHFT